MPHIFIAGKKVPFKHEKIDIFKLKFYPENPRIASIISQYAKEKINDDFIDGKLWGRNETHQLKRRIEQHGGLIHPIIVDGNYVIEGNTRLCCYRHLYEEYNKIKKWRHIPCRVILVKLTKKQVNLLLGSEHILGKIKWDTYEKAHWINTMIERDGYSIKEVKKITGKGDLWIKNMRKSYKTMVNERVTEPKKFSHFMQLFSNVEIKNLEKQDPKIIKKCIKAIKEGQFQEARDLRLVPTIYKYKKSRKEFFDYGENAKQVHHDLRARHPTAGSRFIRIVEDLIKRMRKLKREERNKIAQNKRQMNKIKTLTKECLKLSKELGIKIQIPKKIKKK